MHQIKERAQILMDQEIALFAKIGAKVVKIETTKSRRHADRRRHRRRQLGVASRGSVTMPTPGWDKASQSVCESRRRRRRDRWDSEAVTPERGDFVVTRYE